MRHRVRILLAATIAGGSLLSCNGGTPVNSPSTVGNVSGSVTSSLGGGLANISVVVTPAGGSAMTAVTTNASGAYSVTNVPIGTAGSGTVSVSGVPSNCATPSPATYQGLSSTVPTTANVTVRCVAPQDTLSGTITSSLGGGVAGVAAAVTPTGGTALPAVTSNSSGTFTVTGIGTTGGTITLSNVPVNCVVPSPVAYTGNTSGGMVNAPITLSCSAAAGAITGTITSSQGNTPIAGVSVVVTPHGQNALPAVTTTASGTFTITGVGVSDGTGTLTFSGLPSNCPTPGAPTAYTGLTNGKTLTQNTTITCNPPTGSISGTITSSVGGGLATVGVIVTPAGGAALAAVTTGSSGTYTVSNVPIGSGANAGTGTVTLNHLTPNCTTPSPASYTGLTTNGANVTVNITVTCTTPYGVIHGTIVTSFGTPIANVVATATPTGGTPLVAPASDSTGLFTISGVPVGTGTGSVSFAGFPINCPAGVAAQPYTGLTNARQVTLYVVAPCTKTGAIQITVNPEGGFAPTNTANVNIVGPAPAATLYNVTTPPQIINPLNPGQFTITPFAYQSFDPTVPQIFYPDSMTFSGVEVKQDSIVIPVTIGVDDSVIVTYAWREGSGELWTADSGSTLMSGFSGPQLRQGGNITAANVITQSNPVSPTGMALDSNNKLWVAIGSTGQVLEYRDSAEFGGVSTSYVFATVSGLSNPQGLAFDKNGALWVANAGNNTLSEIVSGAVTATVSSTALNQPIGMAFDASGNAWVTNTGNNTITKFTAAELASAGAETPAVVLSASSGSLSAPTGVAFDGNGNLWVTNSSASTVVEFASSALGATGSPTPTVTIGASAGSLAAPRAVAFDMVGNLWVANETANTIVEYTTAQLAGSGSPIPSGAVTSTGVLSGPTALVFNPNPLGLPINGSRVVRVLKPGVKLNTKQRTVTRRK